MFCRSKKESRGAMSEAAADEVVLALTNSKEVLVLM